ESAVVDEFQKRYKFNLKKKFQCINGVIVNQDHRTLLNEIYTELYITEGDSGDINKEHEIEAASRRKTTKETPIKCNDIFKSFPEEDKPIRTVLMKGVAGIGKTVSVQKFILDWTEGKANQNIPFIFPLPFRELNLMKDQKLSLVELLHVFSSETKEIEKSRMEKALFIFDGLDEYRFPLDFQNTETVCDVTESASVHVLLINLIIGNLLPSALIWITSRPAAADQIPSQCVHRVTEVRGFSDPQKEEYFRRRFSDQKLASNIITHLKSLRSLYIMCHIPVFCWISAAVLERMLGESESGEIPKTLTQMYTHFLIIQTNIIREKYSEMQESDEEMILKLGRLAFQQLEKGNLIFYEEDLRECGIDVTEAAVYSGVCTQIFREEFGLHQCKVYCFVHLSIQEHLAALYVHLTFMKENVFQQNQVCRTLSNVHRCAVDQAIKNQAGHLDLFLRFLLGLSLESNQKLLLALVKHTGSSSQSKEEAVQYIKEKISEDLPTERSIILFHCLNELGDSSLVEEIQQYLKSGKQSELSSLQWSALVFVLLTSAQEQEEFDLSKYTSSENIKDDVLVKLMPVISASRKAIIKCDTMKRGSCSALVSVLNSETSSLKQLHLTVNTLNLSSDKQDDSRMKNLSVLLENPHCKIKNLKLDSCDLSVEGCTILASALRSNPSHLRELDLSENELGDTGVKNLSAILENLHCKLETLRLRICEISGEGCDALKSALSSNPSHLRELDLHGNRIGDSGVEFLSDTLENPHCKLERLGLECCEFTDKGCAALTSALKSNPSHLRYLDLSQNKVEDAGAKCLATVLENPQCKLETLRLYSCGITDEGFVALNSALKSNPSHLRNLNLYGNKIGQKLLSDLKNNEYSKLQEMILDSCDLSVEGCAALTSALRANPSHLRELDLSGNDLGDTGVKDLSSVIENLHCKLEILRLRICEISGEGCDALKSALSSNPSHLRELDLHGNRIRDSGVKFLSDALENPHCKLERLGLDYCEITVEGCAALTSALKSNPSHLRYLDLSQNKVGDAGVKCLAAVLENPQCKLETLRLYNCGIRDEGCVALNSALKSNPSHLRNLDLYGNKIGESGQKLLSDLKNNEHYKLQKLIQKEKSNGGEREINLLTAFVRSNWQQRRENIPNDVSKKLFTRRRQVPDYAFGCLTLFTRSAANILLSVTQHTFGGLVESRTFLFLGTEKVFNMKYFALVYLLCYFIFCSIQHVTLEEKSCKALASVLSCNSSNLRELDLSGSKLTNCLSEVLGNPHCKLETLRLNNCGFSEEGFAALTSALRSNPSHLKDLDLSFNKVGDLGVKYLSAILENPHCKLERLCLYGCGVSDKGCVALSSALRLNPSHLRDLNLSENKLGDSGVKFLSGIPHCKLERLWLSNCGFSEEGCAVLTSALRSNPSHLTELDLSQNKLGDSGVKCLSAVLENPHCKLEILKLHSCGVSDEGCVVLTSALRSNPSHLRDLNLSGNKLGDSGVKYLSAILENPHCKLERLWLCKCGVSDDGCAVLTSVLRSNPSHLRDLNMSQNKLGDSGVKCLSALQENPHCKLKILK
ncbi:NLR family CARD domain-containing protein 3 isoform X17, partial [Silurus meridionalis]